MKNLKLIPAILLMASFSQAVTISMEANSTLMVENDQKQTSFISCDGGMLTHSQLEMSDIIIRAGESQQIKSDTSQNINLKCQD